MPIGEVAKTMDLTEEQVQRGFDDITRKIRTTEYLRLLPPVMEARETVPA